MIKDHVDILFGNEEELKTLFAEDDFYKALDLVKPLVEIAAVTRNAKGSVVVNGRVKILSKPKKSTTSSIRPVPAICMPPVFCMA